jgi:hypothetical protein
MTSHIKNASRLPAILSNGDNVMVGFSDKSIHPNCDCHFAFQATKEQRECKTIEINGLTREILKMNKSRYISDMWNFHAKTIN